MAVAPQRALVPAVSVMPPEGIAPVVDPASTGTADDASPTTKVLSYLKSRGFQPTSENVRRALEANQRDPGVIPGLVSDRPATEAEDQAAMAAARGGARGGGGKPNPFANPINPTWETVNTGSPNTSSPPATDPNALNMQWGPGAAALATAILGGGAYAGSKLFQQARTPVPGQSVPPPPDVGGPRPGALPGELDYTPMRSPPTEPAAPNRGPGTVDYTQLAPSPEAQVTPFDTAMNRAVPPSPVEGVQPVGPPGGMNRAPPQGPVEPIPPQRITPQTLADLPPPTPPPALAPEELLAAQRAKLRASRTNPTLRGAAQPTAEDLMRAAGRVVRK